MNDSQSRHDALRPHPRRRFPARDGPAGWRAGLLAALAGLVALDWAALDDILTGTDPNVLTEALVVVASIPAAVVLVRLLLGRGVDD